MALNLFWCRCSGWSCSDVTISLWTQLLDAIDFLFDCPAADHQSKIDVLSAWKTINDGAFDAIGDVAALFWFHLHQISPKPSMITVFLKFMVVSSLLSNTILVRRPGLATQFGISVGR